MYTNAPVMLLPSELISALLRCGEIRFAEFAEEAVSYFVSWGNLFRILCISLHARSEEGEDDKSDTRRLSTPRLPHKMCILGDSAVAAIG